MSIAPHPTDQPEYVMQISGTPRGERSVFDGQWIVEYDPTIAGVSPAGTPMRFHLVCTTDRSLARRFPDAVAAHAYWTTPSGQPPPADRPLTYYNVTIEEWTDHG